MKKHFNLVLLAGCLTTLCFGAEIEQADEVAHKYCKQEFTYTGSLPLGYTGDVNKRMYFERMMQLKDGKLMAYYAKDLIREHLSMYEKFLETGISWKGAKVTNEDEKSFKEQIIELKRDLELVEKHYPTDLKVYDRINKLRFENP